VSIELIECVDFAAIKHRNQRRKDSDSTPYINHPVGKVTFLIDVLLCIVSGLFCFLISVDCITGVARILTSEAGIKDLIVLQAALLHDTVEDTDTTFEELEKKFGKAVTDVVREVTDDKSLPSEERKRLQIVHAPTSSHEAKLVKLADKLYNLRDLCKGTPRGWSSRRCEEYFKWSKKVVDGLRGNCPAIEKELDKIFIAKGLM
jgi:guanosine-3',5'-bis(diphosphate) 3'-pyrophosphohydrolase